MSKLNYKNHPKETYIEIEGINYSYEFFKMIGMELILNEPFIITRRENKTVTVEKYEADEIVPIPPVKEGMKDYGG